MFYDVYLELCQKAGEKPYVVAAMCGAKSNSSVAQWQRGSVPRKAVLEQIAAHFNVTIDFLLTGKEKAPTREESELSEREVKLLEAFRALTEEQQESVLLLLSAAAQTPANPASGG